MLTVYLDRYPQKGVANSPTELASIWKLTKFLTGFSTENKQDVLATKLKREGYMKPEFHFVYYFLKMSLSSFYIRVIDSPIVWLTTKYPK